MTNTITIRGNIRSIRDRLGVLSEVIKNRKALGWSLLQEDEEWSYTSMWDERTCPVCLAYHKQGLFSGDEVLSEFPDLTRKTETTFKPNVHHTHPELKGECRCILTLLHPAETMENRLHGEKTEVVGLV